MTGNTYESTSDPQDAKQPVQFTGIVVTYNEARHLRECLNSLAFCEQLLVIDLGSVDESMEIARECGAEVVHHERVPFVEQVWPDAVSLARNSWIVRSDPDEIFPFSLVDDLIDVIAKSQSLAMVSLPHQYYFRGKPLKTTIWGGTKYISNKVFHKDRVQLKPHVHRGIRCRNGYYSERIKGISNNLIQHYWADTFGQLFEKHRRYIKHEGESRYNSGQHFSWYTMIIDICRALGLNLINCRGLRGGFTGIFLSFFYSWYTLMSWLSLRKYERHQQS